MPPPNLLHLINEQIQQLDFSWQQFFHSIALEPWWQQLLTKLITAYQRQKVTPPITKLFRALTFFPLPKTKVVILGQDPYHTPNVANGLAFGVDYPHLVRVSLSNIYQKLTNEYNLPIPISFLDLKYWAAQGVLLLNTSWSVQLHLPNSHAQLGWEHLTTRLLQYLIARQPLVAFVAWGQKAQRIISNLPLANNQYWQASHPSGFSAHISFFTIPVFKPINQLLSDWKKQPINWLAGAQFY